MTLDTLEALEQQIKVIKHDNGIYKVRTITDEEDIIPVPAIGKLVYNIEEEESTIRKEDVNGTERNSITKNMMKGVITLFHYLLILNQ